MTLLLRVAGLSDVGRTRAVNQDSMLIADLNLLREGGLAEPIRDFTSTGTVELEIGPRGFLFLVADGMGGAQAGEVASQMAATGVYEELVTEWSAVPHPTPSRFMSVLKNAVSETNRSIWESAHQHAEHYGMGTTLTAGGLLDDVFYLAQVGDSRAYHVRDGVATQLSRDQSIVEELVRAGQLDPEEAANHARKNILLQAMGTTEELDIDLSFQAVRSGDTLLLCSDGLTGLVSDIEIGSAVQTCSELSIACGELVAMANARGGTDNITVAVVEVVRVESAEGRGDHVGYTSFVAGPPDG